MGSGIFEWGEFICAFLLLEKGGLRFIILVWVIYGFFLVFFLLGVVGDVKSSKCFFLENFV